MSAAIAMPRTAGVIATPTTIAAPIITAATAMPYPATSTIGFGTVAGVPNLASTAYAGAPIGFGTTAYQANLPPLNQPVAAPQYQSVVAQQSGYIAPTTTTIQAGLPTSQSMIAYPGVSAMDGPFKFTAGTTYASGANTQAATPVAKPPEEKKAAPKSTVAKKKSAKKTKKGCC